MTTRLISGLGAVKGCRFLPESRQLIFVELDRGVIGLLDLAPTDHPSNPYRILGTDYYKPNDIAVTFDGKTAYIAQQQAGPILGGGGMPEGTNLLKVNLEKANRSEATVIYSSKKPLTALQQIFLDEPRQHLYVIERPNRLLRIDLASGQMTVVLDRLDNPRGLLISADLNYAYISDLRSIRRYSLKGDEVVDIATGLRNPCYLTWADKTQSSIFVTQDQPSRVTIVDTIRGPSSVRDVVTKDLGNSPMSVAYVDAARLLVCCATEIYMSNPMENIPMPSGLFKGIGRVLLNFINYKGLADTTKEPQYPYPFDNAPFGGLLSLNIDHKKARIKGLTYYRIRADDKIRYDTWSDMKFNPKTRKWDIRVDFTPKTVGDVGDGKDHTGFYLIHQNDDMANTDLAMVLNSNTLSNKKQEILIEFADIKGNVKASEFKEILIDNNRCFAQIEMPKVNGVSVPNECGMLKCTSDQELKMAYYASHPSDYATYKWRLGRGGRSTVQADGCSIDSGDVKAKQFIFGPIKVKKLLEGCEGAAFYAILVVYAKATNGEYRLSGYDAHYTVAFALTT